MPINWATGRQYFLSNVALLEAPVQQLFPLAVHHKRCVVPPASLTVFLLADQQLHRTIAIIFDLLLNKLILNPPMMVVLYDQIMWGNWLIYSLYYLVTGAKKTTTHK